MSKWLGIATIAIGSVGIFLGCFYLGRDAMTSLRIVTITTVATAGILGFARHVFFHKSDAARLGWETDRPEWAYEVGFANLAFGVMGLIAILPGWGVQAQALALIGFSLYLFQAAMLHGYGYFTAAVRSPAKLWRSTVATLLFAIWMAFFAVHALLALPKP